MYRISQQTPKFLPKKSNWALFLYRYRILNWANTMAAMNKSNFHLLSSTEFETFFREVFNPKEYTLFDIGAGNGSVTANLVPLFDKTIVYEPAYLMRFRLKQNLPSIAHLPMNMVKSSKLVCSVFNVFDIADNPDGLLKSILSLEPKFLIVSVPSDEFPQIFNDSRFGSLRSWTRVKYFDLNDQDYLWCYLAIFELQL